MLLYRPYVTKAVCYYTGRMLLRLLVTTGRMLLYRPYVTKAVCYYRPYVTKAVCYYRPYVTIQAVCY